MKNTTSKHQHLKTTFALGASALGAATSHAGIVYWDNSGNGLTVTSIDLTDSYQSLDVYYDAATHQFGTGGSYDYGLNRGVKIVAEGKSGKYNHRWMRALGMTPLPYGRNTTSIVGKGISAGTTVNGSTVFPFDLPLSDPLVYPRKTDGAGMGFYSGSDLYVGIRILASDTPGDYNSGDWNYGWASISTSPDGLSVTLNAIAMESDVNAGINVGDKGLVAVPEPGNLVSLAALVGSAAFMRSRRKTSATAA